MRLDGATAARERLELLKQAAERTAREIHVSPHAPVRRYFSAAGSMLRQGRTYLVEGSLEQAFVLLYRFNIFFLEVLPAHPEFATREVATERKRLKAECKAILDQVASVKQTLLQQYGAEEEAEPAGGWTPGSLSAAGDADVCALAARLAALRGEAGAATAEPGGPEAAGAGDGTRGSASAAASPPAVSSELPSYDELALSRPLFPARHEAAAPWAPAPPTPTQGYPQPAPGCGPLLFPVPPVASPQLMGMPAGEARTVQPPSAGRALSFGGPTVSPSALAPVEMPSQPPPRDALFSVMGYPSTVTANAGRPSPWRSAPAATAPSLESLNSQPVTYHNPAHPASQPAPQPQPSAPRAPAWQRGMLDMPAAPGGARAPACSAGAADAAASPTPGAFARAGYAGCGGCGEPAHAAARLSAARAASLSSRGPSAMVPALSPGQLRPLRIPDSVARTFLDVSRANTARNVETCGILLGALVQGVLNVETLLVPAQEGTSDTCVTTNEDQIWEYCDAHELMTLGWIHTHPSQVGGAGEAAERGGGGEGLVWGCKDMAAQGGVLAFGGALR